ncbi:MAG: hypothetical protein H8E30_00840 [Alphaproteobacteria bacterium]|nr:hypothetical protein [Alphaproteobacteria bacterium]
MIKKFVSNALLSVVLDKDARKKLHGMRPDKPAGGKTSGNSLDDDTSGEDVIDTIAQALAEARAEVSRGPHTAKGSPTQRPAAQKRTSAPPAPAPQSRQSTARAAPTPERERLIQEAMAIHREKSHVLDELDPAVREKLMVMAMYAMDPSSLPPDVRQKAKMDAEADGLTGNNGLVDDIGASPLSPRKKPLPRRN